MLRSASGGTDASTTHRSYGGGDLRHRAGLHGAGALNDIADLEREVFALEIDNVIAIAEGNLTREL